MSKLQLSFACWNYDRIRGLVDERVPVDGIDLIYHNLPVEETFFRMLRHREFDVAEMSLSSYAVTFQSEDPAFIAIPIFPSRAFRHSSIYINTESEIREPKDLIGKRIGNPEYQMTAPVWIRGLMQDEYGWKITIHLLYRWRRGAGAIGKKLTSTYRQKFAFNQLLPTRRYRECWKLARSMPSIRLGLLPVFRLVQPKCGASFQTIKKLNANIFRRTHIFPIMHTVVIRRDVYREHPWVAQSLYKAFMLAQKEVYEDLHQTAALKFMLPWLIQHVADTEKIMGRNFWTYGFQANCSVLSTFLRYHHEQGLSKRLLDPEELFAPETFEAFKI